MSLRRPALLLAAALLIPACDKEGDTVIINSTTAPGGAPSPFPIVGVPGGSASGFNEDGGVGDVGSDGQVRSVFIVNDGTNTQIRFARRNADGTWTPILPISNNDASVRQDVTVFVTPNNNFTHIFWLEGASTITLRVHYAQVNNDVIPAIVVPDSNISQGATTNVGIGASYNRVLSYTTALDRATNNIYAMWIQDIVDGGTNTDVPVAGAIIAGAGLFVERFALISPTGAGTNASSSLPTLKVAASGRVHAAWGVQFEVRHRMRTAAATWSNGPAGDTVASEASSPYHSITLDIAADGDAYLSCISPVNTVRAAYRPVGDASVFAADVNIGGAAPLNKLVSALEPGTEHFHVFVGAVTPGSPAAVTTFRNPAANLGGAWETESLHTLISTLGTNLLDCFAWVDSGNRVAVAILMPQTPGQFSHVLVRTRPSGAGNGNYTATADITAPGAQPCGELAVGTNTAGNAVLAWRQGQPHAVPVSEIHGAIYTPGGTFGAAFNVSQTPTVGSHGPIYALVKESGSAYLSWLEAVSSGPDTHDVYFALRP